MPIPRVLEPEAMDSPKEARSYDSMDHQEVNQAFVGRVVELWSGHTDHPAVLDMGCGTAQIPVLLARRLQNGRIVGVDLAENMLVVGAENVRTAGLDDRIMLQVDDCRSLGYDDRSFDLVISNSLLHHLKEPVKALAEARRLAKDSGVILFRDLLRPDSAAQLQGLVENHTQGCDDYQRRMFRDSLGAALTLSEIEALAAEAGLEGAKIYRSSDRHFTIERL